MRPIGKLSLATWTAHPLAEEVLGEGAILQRTSLFDLNL
jgi:hypothetical protein